MYACLFCIPQDMWIIESKHTNIFRNLFMPSGAVFDHQTVFCGLVWMYLKLYVPFLLHVNEKKASKVVMGDFDITWLVNNRVGEIWVNGHYYNDVIMGAIASQITSLTIVYSNVYSGADQRNYQTSKLRVIGLCAWNSPVTGEFPTQMASNAENVFVWWRHCRGAKGRWWFFHGALTLRC